MSTEPRTRPGLDRIDAFWRRHGRMFWLLHSVWALLTGVAVIWLAHERYDFVYWVVGFLVLTWLSTLYFGRGSGELSQTFAARFGRGFASYATRILYQETLFFLIPFYAYSVVVPSWNMAFLGLLGALAVLACLDLVFDRWLRRSPVFSLLFFASVTFGALNLLLPMLFSIDPAAATPVAAALALVCAGPLALRGLRGAGAWLRVALAAGGMLAVALWLRPLVPPTPLRLQSLHFASGLDRDSLELDGPLGDGAESAALDGSLVAMARVFAPTRVPTRMLLDWDRDGVHLRSSREVEIVAHETGFRVWDVLRSEDGPLPPGRYQVVLRTADDRVFGSASVELR